MNDTTSLISQNKITFASLNKQELGKLGEKEAANCLRNKGLEILECNWRFGRLELDIIAKYKNTLVFVEVKSRSTDYFENPEDAVTPNKQKSMLKAASGYCQKMQHDGPVRFDVISVIIEPQEFRILHHEDAFYPMG